MIGVDVGQRRESTGIAVAEEDRRDGEERPEVHFLVRHLQRLPPGTPYPAVARRVKEIARAIHTKTRARPDLYIDATGLGQAVVELFSAAGGTVVACYFTHGDRRTEPSPREVILGKAYLVARLQALLQTGRLHLPLSPEAKALAEDLRDFEVRVDETANGRPGAFPVGSHDDLVTAVGLAVQNDRRRTCYAIAPPRSPSRRQV